MLELGETSDGYHREIGQAVAKCNFDMLACIGPKAALIAESAEQSGIPRDRIHRFPDAKEAAQIFPQMLQDNDLVLLKGSRSMHLEEIDAAIKKSRQDNSHEVKVAS